MIYTTLDNFYLSDDALENSPSRRDGIDRDTENMLRMYGCELIQQAGIMLQYDQAVMATAQVLFHRFYCKRSMKNFNVKKVAATALWQGCKLEEVSDVQRHPGELLVKVMVAIDRCTARRDAPEARKLPILDVHSKEGEEFKRSLIRYELEMLKAFGFITHVEHPHKQMLNYCQALKLDQADLHLPVPEGYTSKASVFIQEVWNVANDSLRTTLCVRFRSSVVACGIIFYTARKLKVPLPEDPPWWELFGVKLPQMCEVCRALHDLYRAPKPHFIPVCHTLLPSKPPTPQGGSAGGAPPSEPGATPDLGGRPGGKPLDPSVRRAVGPGGATPAAAATPGMAANGSVSAAGAASAKPSPVQPPAAAAAAAAGTPGSAPRKRPGSPRDSPDGPSKRQQRDGSVPDLAGAAAAAATAAAALVAASSSAGTQQQQQQPVAAAAGLPPAPKPRRSSHRSRSRSRSRERSKRHRSRSRSRDRDRDRGSRGGDKSSHRDRHGSSRSHHRHDRDSDRDRGKRHSKEAGRADKSSGGGGGGGRDDKPPREQQQQQRQGNESTTPTKDRDGGKQQPQPAAFPPPPLPGAGKPGDAAAGQLSPPLPDCGQAAATNGSAAAAGEQKPPAAKPKPVAKKKVAPPAAAAAGAAPAERQSSPGAGAGSSGGS